MRARDVIVRLVENDFSPSRHVPHCFEAQPAFQHAVGSALALPEEAGAVVLRRWVSRCNKRLHQRDEVLKSIVIHGLTSLSLLLDEVYLTDAGERRWQLVGLTEGLRAEDVELRGSSVSELPVAQGVAIGDFSGLCHCPFGWSFWTVVSA